MLCISFIFGDATNCVECEGEEKVLNGEGNRRRPLVLIGDVVGDVGHAVDEVHPSKFVGGEEFKGTADHFFEPILDPFLN